MPPLIPRDYQTTAIEFLISKKRGACYDDVGLGKTLVGLLAAKPPVLVACPTYLIPQWNTLIRQQFPLQTCLPCTGASHERALKLTLKADWHIINIEMLRSHKFPVQYNTFLIDEAHHLRGRTALQAKNASKLARRIPNHIQLTATPIKKDISDFFMQLQLIDYENFHSYGKFLDDWCLYHEDNYGIKIIGPRDVNAFREMLAKYGIRRSYKDTARELPELIESVVSIEGTPEWQKLYRECKNYYTLESIYFANGSQVYSALRQIIASKQKLEYLTDLISDLPNDDGVVIFSDYRSSAELVAKTLNVPYIHGGIKPADRIQIAKENKIISATIESLSEGADLSAKSTIIFFEEVHSPGSMHQAKGRVVRDRANIAPVRCYYLHMKNSLDERIHAAQLGGTSTIESILKDEFNG